MSILYKSFIKKHQKTAVKTLMTTKYKNYSLPREYETSNIPHNNYIRQTCETFTNCGANVYSFCVS